MAIDANSRIAPARPLSSPQSGTLNAPDIRRILRLCANCSAAIVEHAATVDPDEARAFHALANAIDSATADWAANAAHVHGLPTPAPAIPDLLHAYNEWLANERKFLIIEQHPDATPEQQRELARVILFTGAGDFHFPSDRSWKDVPKPSTRAARIMAAAGVRLGGAR